MDYHGEDFVWNEGNCVCGPEIEIWIDRRKNRRVGESATAGFGRVVDENHHVICRTTL